VPDHQLNVGYVIDFKVSDIAPPAGGSIVTRQESLSGRIETNYYGERRIWTVKTQPYERSSDIAARLREFLRSTADGQTFSFDPYGRGTTVVSVIREDEGFSEDAFLQIDGLHDFVQYGFQLREE
jgi:hypothetical protein